MKKISSFLLFLVALCTGLQAQTPQSINYQAVIRDNSVNPPSILANQAIGLEIVILDQNNNAVYSETHSATTNAFGLVNVKVGEGISSGSLSTINWGLGDYSLQTAVDIAGGTNYAVLGTSDLSSVPYTFQSANSLNVSDPDRDTRIEMSDDPLDNQIQIFTAGSRSMTIDSMQRVGVGTSAPKHPLDVRGDVVALGLRAETPNYSSLLEFKDFFGGRRGIVGLDGLGTSSGENQFILGSWTKFPVSFYTNAQKRMVIDTIGRVGIGTNTPSASLEVNGNFKLTDGNQSAGRILTSDANGEGSWQDLNLPAGSTVPSGGIIMWNGSVPPAGWALCDGSNGTPDLRGRFVLGSGQSGNLSSRLLGDTGGEEEVTLSIAEMPAHAHNVNDPGHSHSWSASRQLAGTDDNNNTTELSRGDRATVDTMVKTTTNETTGITVLSTGGGAAHENMPPFYTLAYIMKL